MATIDNSKVIILRDVDLEIEGNNFKKFVNRVVFTPSSETVSFTPMAPDSSQSAQTEPTWTVELQYVQDWEEPLSLSQLLYKKAGDKEVVRFKPRAGAGLPVFVSDVTLAHGAIGGDGGAYPVTTVSMGCTKPVIDTDDAPGTVEPDYPEVP